jgi:murein DD-endopeptidase MepM/ murein hydrolase activator NlpD
MAAAILAGSGGSLAGAGLPGPRSSQPGGASESADLALGHVGQRDLRLGSSSAAVTVVERRLLELGYAVEVDRYFDSGTHRAVRRFQRSEGLRPDGIVGPATWRALFPASSGAAPERQGMTLPSGGGSASEEEARTRFAVRMAGAGELSSDERRRLGLGGPSLRSEGEGDDGALIAIEFENGTTVEAGPSSSEPGSERAGAARDSAHERSTVDRSSESQAGPPAESPSHQSEDTGVSGPAPNPAGPEQPPAAVHSGAGVCGSERMIAPVAGATFTSSYRSAHRPSHAGIDLAAPSGTPIRSVACGVVSFLAGTAQTGGYGNYICVKHSSRLTTCYAHLSRFSDERVGGQVRRGEVIGYVGNTGHSTGPHLHFEVRTANPYGRNDVDPVPYLAGRSIPGTRVGPSAIGGPDLTSTPQQEPSAGPAARRPGASGAPGAVDAPAGGSPTSALSDRSLETMGEASETAPTEGELATAASGGPPIERRAMGTMQATGLEDTESSDDTSPGGGSDLQGEASSDSAEAAPGQSTNLAATEGRGGLGLPEGETQEPTDETEESTGDGNPAETPSPDDGEGLETSGDGVASAPAEEEDDLAPAPGARVPSSGLQATPFGGVDPLLLPGLTPGVDSTLGTLPDPVTPGDEEGEALETNGVPPDLLSAPEAG